MDPAAGLGRRGFGDGVSETLRHAGIAPVVHVQPVGRHERLKRHVIDFAPVLHHVEAGEQVDVFLVRGPLLRDERGALRAVGIAERFQGALADAVVLALELGGCGARPGSTS